MNYTSKGTSEAMNDLNYHKSSHCEKKSPGGMNLAKHIVISSEGQQPTKTPEKKTVHKDFSIS